ncbi:MAG: endolytic transglycosylase MltG [Herbinix sp.]|jgi:UPF0755 protein|nr:endolytic transglycosylase MltG [Herbinix sp.]
MSSSTSVKITLKISSLILRLLLNTIFVILLVVLVIYGSRTAYNFTYQLYGPVTVESEPGRTVPIRINKGESSMDIAGKLEVNRVIVDKYSFYFRAKLQDKVIMPGTYRVNSSMTYNEILDIITDYSNSEVQDSTVNTDED